MAFCEYFQAASWRLVEFLIEFKVSSSITELLTRSLFVKINNKINNVFYYIHSSSLLVIQSTRFDLFIARKCTCTISLNLNLFAYFQPFAYNPQWYTALFIFIILNPVIVSAPYHLYFLLLYVLCNCSLFNLCITVTRRFDAN